MRQVSKIAAAMALLVVSTGSVCAADADGAIWVSVRINGTEQPDPALIERDENGNLLAPRDATSSWHLPLLAVPA